MLRLLGQPSSQIVLAALAIAVAIVGVFGYGQWTGYESAIQRTERDLRSAAGLLAEHMARTFEGAEESLAAVAGVREDVVAGRVPRDPETLHNILRAIHGGSPVFRGVGWIDENGQQVASSASPVPLRVNIADQEHFRVHLEGTAADGVYVGAPIRSSRDGSWIINATLPLRAADGSFAGVANVALDPKYFHRVYTGIELGPSGVVTLFRRDGVILARYPGGDQLIGTVAQQPFPAEATGGVPRGIFHARGLSDPADQIVGYTLVPGTAFVLTAAQQRAEALAEFHSDLVLNGIQTTLWVLMLLAGAAALARGWRRRERLQDELRAATKVAESANLAKSDFLQRMSHEVRTPLSVVIGFAELMQRNRDRTLSPVQLKYAQHIAAGGQHLLNLINEVLDLSGIEAGKIKLLMERVAVFELLNQVRQTMEPVAAKNGVDMLAIHTGDVPDIRADRQRLRQVLLNLVSNAVKYNRPGGSVSLAAARAADGRVRILVTDTGMGIAPVNQPHLFQPFNRLGAEYTDVEGTGLGLALSKLLVEAMGGSIGFITEMGRGSTFWFELPGETADAPLRVGATPAHADAPRHGAGGYTILYVDDNSANLQLVQHLVAAIFPDVTLLTAPRPRLGLDLAVAHRPDVIILDLNLPEMSGFELRARLRAMPETSNIPVLALSAAAMPKDIKRGQAAGFFSYMTKPIDIDEFRSSIEAALAAGSGPALASAAGPGPGA